jgi:REP element-mobilizing transposase RayT
MRFQRKPNRLPPASYDGGIFFVTMNCEGKAPYLAGRNAAVWCRDKLLQEVRAAGMGVLAFVVMPDHLHFLVEGYESALPAVMKSFKQKTAYEYKKRFGRALWQKSYYDHIVRREEDLASIAEYIAANPVRRGLVSDWEAYEFSGGLLLARSADPLPPPGDLKVAATPRAATPRAATPRAARPRGHGGGYA